jgi:hypothetical protein
LGLRKTVLTFRARVELTNSASFERIALPGLYLLTITLGTVQWSRGEWHRSSFKRFAYFKI